MDLKPFSFVTDPLTRKYTTLNPICTNTLKKYMEVVVKYVERKLCDSLPDKFALVIDGWTEKSTHFVAVFASYPDAEATEGYSTALLAFSPMGEETGFTAQVHKDFLEWVLSVYRKSLENIVCIIGDNCETNKALSNFCGKPFVGCASHRFHLAMMKLMEGSRDALEKVNSLMMRLRGLKLAGELRKHTNLTPCPRNVTRWSSTANMLNRYFELKPYLFNFEGNLELLDLMPTPRENTQLQELKKVLSELDSVTKALQRSDVDLADVRCVFDEVIRRHPETAAYLGADAKIIHSIEFENGARKIVEKNDSFLTPLETTAVESLKTISAAATASESEPVHDFAFSLLKKRKTTNSAYLDCRFILPTSNIVERFFSAAGNCFSDSRQKLLPLNLEMQLFLKVNKSWWPDAQSVAEASVNM